RVVVDDLPGCPVVRGLPPAIHAMRRAGVVVEIARTGGVVCDALKEVALLHPGQSHLLPHPWHAGRRFPDGADDASVGGAGGTGPAIARGPAGNRAGGRRAPPLPPVAAAR